MTESSVKSDYCQTLVRTHDPDRYLMSMFFEAEAREHLWALYAFNHEIAKTREVVTDTHIGLIRLQWWRDALAAFYEKNEVLHHDVMKGLADAIWRHDLPRELFDHLIYAREFDLEDRAPGSLEGLCNYADFTHAPLLRMGLTITGGDPDHPSLAPVAMAYALTGLLRALPFHATQGRCYLPEDLLRREGLVWGSLELSRNPENLIPVTRAIRERAEDLLRQATPKGESALARLHRNLTLQYLHKIKRLNDNCYDFGLTKPLLFRELFLWKAARFG